MARLEVPTEKTLQQHRACKCTQEVELFVLLTSHVAI